jgi:diguanylate cyclase (GGDEF)-like protein
MTNSRVAWFLRMVHVDVLSGYLICGASSLVGAVLLRMAETGDASTGRAVRVCGHGFVVLGLGLLPAGVPAWMGHAAAQLSLAFGALAGMVLIGAGLAELQGRGVRKRRLIVLLALCAAALSAALWHSPHSFVVTFTAGLVIVSCLMLWWTRVMLMRPRDLTERAMAAVMVVLILSCGARFGFTLSDAGTARHDLMHVPEPLASVFAALYGVLPMIVSTLLLTLVNTRLRRQLRRRAITDELTGTMTRRALRELAPALLQREQTHQRDVAVLMLDLDRFKHVNDTYGHQAGDAVLRLAAQALQRHMRVDALLARYGGEEFVAIVPVDGMRTARRIAERLRHAVESVDWAGRLALADLVTVSLGVALMRPDESLDAALKRADEALYRAKREGRNQCQVALEMA